MADCYVRLNSIFQYIASILLAVHAKCKGKIYDLTANVQAENYIKITVHTSWINKSVELEVISKKWFSKMVPNSH